MKQKGDPAHLSKKKKKGGGGGEDEIPWKRGGTSIT